MKNASKKCGKCNIVKKLTDFTKDKHRKVVGRPLGGGPVMVMSAQPLFDAVKKIKGRKFILFRLP